jgi:hypothetical protein
VSTLPRVGGGRRGRLTGGCEGVREESRKIARSQMKKTRNDRPPDRAGLQFPILAQSTCPSAGERRAAARANAGELQLAAESARCKGRTAAANMSCMRSYQEAGRHRDLAVPELSIRRRHLPISALTSSPPRQASAETARSCAGAASSDALQIRESYWSKALASAAQLRV